MAQQIKAKNTSINFTNFENLANKDGYSIGTTQAYGTSTVVDGTTNKVKTTNVVKINTTSQNLAEKLPTPALFLNWSGAQLTFNGNTYTINTTPELLEALLAAGQTATTLTNSNLPIRASVVYNKIQELEEKIAQYEQSYIGN